MLDLLIIGSGLYGATFANLASEKGLRTLVIDRRAHPGGNCHTENVDGIEVHKYGPHVFHTGDRTIWNHVNRFAAFLPYVHRAKVDSNGRLHPFPVNLETIRRFHPEVQDSEDARRLLASFEPAGSAENFEDFLLGKVGPRLYEAFYYGYTKKQWGREPRELPAFIAKRIPIRFDFNDRYFEDPFEGIPRGGYTAMIRNMLRGSEVRLNTDYFEGKPHFDSLARTVLYTGELDRFFDHRFGRLEYRSLRFEEIRLERERFQECAVVNYGNVEIPYTRITEHKHFTGVKTPHTVITREYPAAGNGNYYPVNDAVNNAIYRKYSELAGQCENVLFGGRLAEYKYYDMDHVIQAAMKKFRAFEASGFRTPSSLRNEMWANA